VNATFVTKITREDAGPSYKPKEKSVKRIDAGRGRPAAGISFFWRNLGETPSGVAVVIHDDGDILESGTNLGIVSIHIEKLRPGSIQKHFNTMGIP